MKSFLFIFSLLLFGVTGCKDYSCEQGCYVKSADSTTINNPAFHAIIVCTGNNLTFGTNIQYDSTYPSLLQNKFNDEGVDIMVKNEGINVGCSMTLLQIQLPEIVSRDYIHNISNIAIVWELQQDLFNNNYQPQVIVKRLADYCSLLHYFGYKVVVMTAPYRNSYFINYPITPSGADTTTYTVNLAAVNDSLRANYKSFADILVDIAVDKRFQSYTPRYYQPDHVNLTAESYKAVSEIVFNTLKDSLQ